MVIFVVPSCRKNKKEYLVKRLCAVSRILLGMN